ncbi:hypothetical protein LCGC14_2845820, partial [marine sediment metagenome]
MQENNSCAGETAVRSFLSELLCIPLQVQGLASVGFEVVEVPCGLNNSNASGVEDHCVTSGFSTRPTKSPMVSVW